MGPAFDSRLTHFARFASSVVLDDRVTVIRDERGDEGGWIVERVAGRAIPMETANLTPVFAFGL